MKKVLSFLAFLIVASQLQAQSLLWEVTGKGLEKPSYLYGTIHIMDERVFAFDNVVNEKLEQSEAFAMEILMDNITKETVESCMIMKDKTLKDLLSPEDYKFLDEFCKKTIGQGVFLMDKMKPFFLSSQLMQANMSQDMPDPLDMYFLKKSRAAGKPCYGVEEFEDQIKAIDQISLEEQAEMLMSGIRDTSTEAIQFDDLLETYLKGDIQKMPELSADTSLPANFNEEFLIKRNYGMAKNAIKLFKKQSTFVAVGAAHLGGPEGVIELVRKKGYTVTPIKFEFKEIEKE